MEEDKNKVVSISGKKFDPPAGGSLPVNQDTVDLVEEVLAGIRGGQVLEIGLCLRMADNSGVIYHSGTVEDPEDMFAILNQSALLYREQKINIPATLAALRMEEGEGD